MTAATSHFLLYIVEEILPREPLGSPTAVRHLSARDAPPGRNTCQPTASMSPRGRVASAARWARISGEMDGEARSLVPAVADAANGMIYEEEGRPASTSKGRPTRAGHIFRTRVFNTVHSVVPTVSLLFPAFVLTLRIGSTCRVTFLISRATARVWYGK